MSNSNDSTPNEENKLKEISDDMYESTDAYFRAELELTLDDYKLLEDMNSVTAKKYSEINEIAMNVSKTVDAMNDKYATLLPHLELIDALEDRVAKLETMAYAIDAYSKRLEIKYKQLERK